MRKFLRKILQKKSVILKALAIKLYKYPQEKRVIQWQLDNGDKTLRLNYDLNEESIVFDVGGYEGKWASEIFSKYSCFIYVFEPIEEFARNIQERFSHNRKVFVNTFGLSNETKDVAISLEKDSSSAFKNGGKSKTIKMVNIMKFISNNNIEKIDLMKINIEGGEYDLLEILIKDDFIKNITDIQIQFHDFVQNAEERMINIQNELKKTHNLTFQYPFVWENWNIKRG